MSQVIGAAEMLLAELGVDLGGRDRDVSEHLLDHTDVGAVVEHVAGARVAEHVRTDHRTEARSLRVALHDRPGPLTGEASHPGCSRRRPPRRSAVRSVPGRARVGRPGRASGRERRVPGRRSGPGAPWPPSRTLGGDRRRPRRRPRRARRSRRSVRRSRRGARAGHGRVVEAGSLPSTPSSRATTSASSSAFGRRRASRGERTSAVGSAAIAPSPTKKR